jgi:hypothetical protein
MTAVLERRGKGKGFDGLLEAKLSMTIFCVYCVHIEARKEASVQLLGFPKVPGP